MSSYMINKKVGGVRLKLGISESNLGAKISELEKIKDKLSDVTTERDFLRKIVMNLSDRHS